jgi:glycosyltransferase involved in cell wall biosynthesis
VSSFRILHVSQPADGGVARAVQLLVADQLDRGWDAVVACPGGTELSEHVESAGGRVFDWDASRAPSWKTWSETESLRRLIASVRPDLLHLHSSKAGMAGRCAARGHVSTVFQPHAWSFHALPIGLREVAAGWERAANRWTHAILCVSKREQEEGEARGIRGPWRVVPNGLPGGWITDSSPSAMRAARRRLGLRDAPTVLVLGRLCRQKGQDLLLAIWPDVLRAVPNAQLVFVGDGPLRERLAQKATPSVLFVGHQVDPRAWLIASDVVAVPARWDGLSFALLEALAAGRPVVASDAAGAAEVITDEVGSVLPAVDSAFAAALATWLTEPHKAAAAGRAGRHRVETQFNSDRTVSGVADVYADLARSG